MTAHILLLPGDGVGPEVIAQAKRVLFWLKEQRGFDFTLEEALVGGASYEAYGSPLTSETLALAKQADAILFGAVGGTQWDDVPYDKRPEAALLTLRKELGLFANLRPALCFPALAEASSLKSDRVSGLDILIIRELTGGVYFGEPRGIQKLGDNQRRGVNTHVYDSSEIRRIAKSAFELAQARSNKITSVEKRNVMEAGQLWYEEVVAIAKHYPNVQLNHMLADNCAMQLVREPKQFDVILTDNLFGDLLSDIAAALTGSLGMLPSASLGAPDANGRLPALYEPVHGSAPDIAGQNKANPLAMVLSLAMALRYSFARPQDAQQIETAIEQLLAQGLRTPDNAKPEKTAISTQEMGDALQELLSKNA